MTVGEKIKLIRNEKKISIRKLSEITSLSKSTISEIENNISKNPTIDTLDKIAKALDVQTTELIDSSRDTSNQSDKGKQDISSLLESMAKRAGQKPDRFLRSVARAKDRPDETLDKIADFIDFILEQEDKNK